MQLFAVFLSIVALAVLAFMAFLGLVTILRQGLDEGPYAAPATPRMEPTRPERTEDQAASGLHGSGG
jgi:hypothetical protein